MKPGRTTPTKLRASKVPSFNMVRLVFTWQKYLFPFIIYTQLHSTAEEELAIVHKDVSLPFVNREED